MATPGRQQQPKAMSSRLAGMKFMQRATPPTSPAEPAAKKQRLSSGGFNPSPAPSPRNTDNDALERAAAAQEKKRAEAVAREGEMKGETKWYLSVQTPRKPAKESPLRVLSAGFSALDSTERKVKREEEDAEEEEDENGKDNMPGRISFGKFGRTAKKKPTEDEDSSDEDDSEDDPDGEDEHGEDLSGVDSLIAQGRKEAVARIRKERKEEKKAKQAEAARLAEKRRAKELDLNRPTSISNAGSGGGGANKLANMVCHRCGKKGHLIRECPNERTQRTSKLRQSY